MDQETQKNFNRKIMRRIRFIHYGRKVLHPIVLEILGLFVVAFSIKSMVSLGNVVQNFLQSENIFSYTETAILKTELTVQTALGFGLILGVMLLKHTLKSFKPFNVFKN